MIKDGQELVQIEIRPRPLSTCCTPTWCLSPRGTGKSSMPQLRQGIFVPSAPTWRDIEGGQRPINHRHLRVTSTATLVPLPACREGEGEREFFPAGRLGASRTGGQAGGAGLSGRAIGTKIRVTLRPIFSSMALRARSSNRVAGQRNRKPCTVHIRRAVNIAAKMTSERK